MKIKTNKGGGADNRSEARRVLKKKFCSPSIAVPFGVTASAFDAIKSSGRIHDVSLHGMCLEFDADVCTSKTVEDEESFIIFRMGRSRSKPDHDDDDGDRDCAVVTAKLKHTRFDVEAHAAYAGYRITFADQCFDSLVAKWPEESNAKWPKKSDM